MKPWAQLGAIAERQHGVVCLRDAAAAGVSVRTLRDHARREGWRRPHAGVFVLPGAAWEFPQKAMAALCAAGDQALVAGWSAAHLHGWLARPPRRTQILLPYASRTAPLHAVVTHRSRRLPDEHRDVVRGIPVTTPARTLCDLAMWASGRRLADLVARSVSDGQTTLEEIELARRALGPRRGGAALRAALARLAQDGHTDSGLERRLRAALRRAGLAPAAGTYPVRANGVLLGRIDIAFPQQRVGVEVDGFVWHRTPNQLRRDHERQNALLLAGWRLLRASASDVREPSALIADLRRLLTEA